MTVLGIGNDIVEIERIRQAVQTHGETFLTRLFTLKEQEYCRKHKDPMPCFAGRFAAKEAIVKALGCGFGEQVAWLDLEILNDSLGKPEVHFSPTLLQTFSHTRILISISHCKLYATAVALWVKD